MNVYGYARYSTDHQTESSIEQQLIEIKKYCKQNKHTMIKFYSDSAISGTKENREQFQEMISDCMNKGEVQAVLVWKYDRFARDRYTSSMYKKKLKDKGIKVVSITQRMDDSPESIILEGLLESMDEYYCANLAANVKRKLYQNAKECKFNGGFAPLGYDIDKEKNYIVNGNEAKIVREMFELYNKGYGLVEITNIFNKKGYKTKRGTEFKKNSLHDMIENERYCGTYVYSKSLNHNKRVKRNDIIKIPNGIPAIINREEFDKAMERMAKNRIVSGTFSAKENYLLTGLIQCDFCGTNYVGTTRKKKKNEKTYTSCVYTCRNKYKNGCKSKDIKRDKIEDLVVKLISQDVLKTQEFNNLVEKINMYYKEMSNDSKQSKVEFDIELAKTKDKIQKIITAIEDGLYTVSMKDALLKLEDRKKELLENIEKANNFQNIKIIDRKTIEKTFNNTFKNFPKMTFQQQKELLKLWVKDIKVTNTEVIITFNFFGQHNISLALMAPQTISLVSIRISIDKLR